MIATIYPKVKGLRVTTDTRNVIEGDLFIALKGSSFDGNLFAKEALQKGARYAIIDNPQLAEDARYIVVADCLNFLQQLAAYHRKTLGIPVIAITGTNGKTTTKELCHAVLSRKFNCIATIGNLNNHIGVPLTLLSMTQDTQIAIVEMGANHPKEIEALCKIADPDFGLITNIGCAHLEGFGSYENIIKTKCELYDYIEAKNGSLFVNADDALLMKQLHAHHHITYGTKGNEAHGSIKQSTPYLVLAYHTPKGDLCVKTKLIGGYNFANVMAAIAIGSYFGIDPLDIRDAIESYIPSNMRSQLKRTAHNILIIDAYNANPSSMQVAIENFREMILENKVLILGEMRELGTNSDEEHQKLINLVSDSEFKHVFLIGESFENKTIHASNLTRFSTTEQLIEFLTDHPLKDSSILIKGSRGNRLERIIDLL